MSDSSIAAEMLMLSGVSLILVVWLLILSAQLQAAQRHILILKQVLTEHLEEALLPEAPGWKRREAALAAIKLWTETRR